MMMFTSLPKYMLTLVVEASGFAMPWRSAPSSGR